MTRAIINAILDGEWTWDLPTLRAARVQFSRYQRAALAQGDRMQSRHYAAAVEAIEELLREIEAGDD